MAYLLLISQLSERPALIIAFVKMAGVSNADLLRINRAILKRIKDLEKAFLAFKHEHNPIDASAVVDLANGSNGSNEDDNDDDNDDDDIAPPTKRKRENKETPSGKQPETKRRAVDPKLITKEHANQVFATLPKFEKNASIETLLKNINIISSAESTMQANGMHWKRRIDIKQLLTQHMDAARDILYEFCRRTTTQAKSAMFPSLMRWLRQGGTELSDTKSRRIRIWANDYCKHNAPAANQDRSGNDNEDDNDSNEDDNDSNEDDEDDDGNANDNDSNADGNDNEDDEDGNDNADDEDGNDNEDDEDGNDNEDDNDSNADDEDGNDNEDDNDNADDADGNDNTDNADSAADAGANDNEQAEVAKLPIDEFDGIDLVGIIQPSFPEE